MLNSKQFLKCESSHVKLGARAGIIHSAVKKMDADLLIKEGESVTF